MSGILFAILVPSHAGPGIVVTSQHDPLELLVKASLARCTEEGLVVLDRPEISLAEMPAGSRYFKCIDSRSGVYLLKRAAYDLAASRNWEVASQPVQVQPTSESKTNLRDESAR